MPSVKSNPEFEAKVAAFEARFCESVPACIQQLKPYPAGKPIEETKRELGLNQVVKLASNENPWGPSPLALKAMHQGALNMNLYPDAAQFELREALLNHYGSKDLDFLQLSNIVPGCGSNELIDLLFRVFVGSDGEILSHEKCFAAYKLCASLQGTKFSEAKLDADFEVNIQALLDAVTPRTRMVLLANPNNPTGRVVPKQDVMTLAGKLLEKNILLVLDAAYEEFLHSDENFAFAYELWSKFPNVVALYTFSKIYGLAGMRLGYALAHKNVAKLLHQARQPFNVSSLAAQAGVAALADEDFVRKTRDSNEKIRNRVAKSLKESGFFVTPSRANFLLVDMGACGKSGAESFELLLRKGFIVRPVGNYGLPHHIRVSLGTEEEMESFLKVFHELFPVLNAKAEGSQK